MAPNSNNQRIPPYPFAGIRTPQPTVAPKTNEQRIPPYPFRGLPANQLIHGSSGYHVHSDALRDIGPLPDHITRQMQMAGPKTHQDGNWGKFQKKHILPWFQQHVNEVSQNNNPGRVAGGPPPYPREQQADPRRSDNGSSVMGAESVRSMPAPARSMSARFRNSMPAPPPLSEHQRVPKSRPPAFNFNINNNSGYFPPGAANLCGGESVNGRRRKGDRMSSASTARTASSKVTVSSSLFRGLRNELDEVKDQLRQLNGGNGQQEPIMQTIHIIQR